MWIGVITLFPDMFKAVSEFGVTGRAIKRNLITLECWNPRDFTKDKYNTVDDRPYGGGAGMLMMVQPLKDAIYQAKQALQDRQFQTGEEITPPKVIYLSPQGRKLDQAGVETLAKNQNLILICGRYEGIDERLIATDVDEEWSIGDYVLTGGELPAMVLIDSIARFVPEVLGKAESAQADSFAQGLLDHPHYTRPELLDGLSVPEILLSGNHEQIRKWRLRESLKRTLQRRPELLESLALTEEQLQMLAEIKGESVVKPVKPRKKRKKL